MMDNSFNPMVPMLQGQQVHQNMLGAQMQGMSLAERLALKKAAGALGSQNYFAGYEGVPGAERPAALSEAWQNADPAEAAKLEAMYAEPFKLKRAAELVGTAEAAKDAARYGAFGSFIDAQRSKWMPQSLPGVEPGGQNAMTARLEGGNVATEGAVPEPTPQTDPYASLRTPRPKINMGFTNGSPSYSETYPDALETAKTIDEMRGRGVTESQAEKKFSQEQLNQAHTAVRESASVLKNAREQYMATGQGKEELALAQQDYQASRGALDALVKGKSASSVASVQSPVSAPTIVGPNVLSPMKQQDITKKKIEQQNTDAEKEVVAVRERSKGQQVVRTVIDSLRDQFTKLNEAGGITNTDKNPLGNIAAGSASSSPGQFAGKLLGTKSQSLRNTIAQQRPILMTSIMKATGMTAKQMDSNVELKLWLATATDPTLDFQTNMKALDTLEQLYGKEIVPGEATVPKGSAKVMSDADYQKLPSGTVFTGPDGKQRKKP